MRRGGDFDWEKMVLQSLKYAAAGWIKRNPYTWSLFWNVLPRLTFLLPHDKSYFGFRHLATEKHGLFLDIGANNGMTAAGFRRINEGYDILSIEANVHHRAALERLRATLTRFEYRNLGAGSARDRFKLYTPMYKGIPIHTHTSTSMEYLHASLGRDFSAKVVRQITYDEQVVTVVPLDELQLAPSIIKVDVEGADFHVLLGLRATIEKHRPHVMIEYTPEHMGAFETFFDELRYGLFVYDVGTDRFKPFRKDRETQTWQMTALQVNVFCIPLERVSILPLGEGGHPGGR